MPRREPELLRLHGKAMDTYLIAQAHFLADDGVIDANEQTILGRIQQMMRGLEKLNIARLISHAIADDGIDLDDPEKVAALEVLARPQNVRSIRAYQRDLGSEPDEPSAA